MHTNTHTFARTHWYAELWQFVPTVSPRHRSLCVHHSCLWLLNMYFYREKDEVRPKEKERKKEIEMKSSHKKNVEWIYYFDCAVCVFCRFCLWSIDSRRAIIHMNWELTANQNNLYVVTIHLYGRHLSNMDGISRKIIDPPGQNVIIV